MGHLHQEIRVNRGSGRQIDDAHSVEAQIQEDAVVTELEVGVYKAHSPIEFLVQRNRRVDGDRRRPYSALGPVEKDYSGRRALLGRRWRGYSRDNCRGTPRRWNVVFVGLVARQKAAHPGHKFGRVERLGEVIIRTGS